MGTTEAELREVMAIAMTVGAGRVQLLMEMDSTGTVLDKAASEVSCTT